MDSDGDMWQWLCTDICGNSRHMIQTFQLYYPLNVLKMNKQYIQIMIRGDLHQRDS